MGSEKVLWIIVTFQEDLGRHWGFWEEVWGKIAFQVSNSIWKGNLEFGNYLKDSSNILRQFQRV